MGQRPPSWRPQWLIVGAVQCGTVEFSSVYLSVTVQSVGQPKTILIYVFFS
eukprot:NODE_3733_length_336_cov_44.247387_g3062_i0.p3 GENE.NODE_3733_length_336_cov_44.247387_g3062_i0~~NODE_3733_length_336_cov_44.247387_g3062_i0.p3  ORF type:complete len:51 (+),score=2.90 NODE_3733_length_336_cov_44.247387_g3062_i0:34-186(+)